MLLGTGCVTPLYVLIAMQQKGKETFLNKDWCNYLVLKVKNFGGLQFCINASILVWVLILPSSSIIKMDSLTKKFITCIVATLCVIAVILNIFNTGEGISWYPPIVSIYISVILFFGSIIWAIVWHRQSKKTINSQKHFEILYAIIRYFLAFNISFFGWAKLLELQFRVPESISSGPMNQQSGEWLTWYYFGYSYTFTLILAFLQIAGATLLLFRKTVLFGAFILFALMSIITLINIFYGMNAGALLMSVLITIGITYIILLHYKKLIAFFFPSHSNGASSSGSQYILRSVLWLSAIVLSLLFVLYMKSTI